MRVRRTCVRWDKRGHQVAKGKIIALWTAIIAFVGAVITALNYPAVEGIGTKVRLPVFHGAMTWANLVILALLALLALNFLIRKTDSGYGYSEAFRWVAIAMWIIGSVLGFIAALNTWDFTGSQTPVIQLLMGDPRLVIQLIVALSGLIVLILPTITESRKILAGVDLAFPILTFAGLSWAVNAGRALHPDSPVLNSDELKIKFLFFLMFGLLLLASLAAGYLIKQVREKNSSL